MNKFTSNKLLILNFLILQSFHTYIHSVITITPTTAYVIPNTTTSFTISNFPAIAVANEGSNTVSIINTSNYTVAHIVTDSSLSEPTSLAYSPNGIHIAVANYGTSTISIINTTDYTVTHTVTVGTEPISVAYSPDGTHIAVANFASNTISIINTTDYTVTHTVPVGTEPISLAYSPGGTHIAVANENSNTVSIINTTDYTVTHTVTDSSFNEPLSVAYSPDGTHIAVSNLGSNTVSIINTNNYTVTHTVPVSEPGSLAYSPDGTNIAVSSYNLNTVSIINTIDYKITNTITVGKYPRIIAYSLDGNHIATANLLSNTVSIINTNNYTVTHTVTVGSAPASVTYSPLTALASYVNITGPDGYSQNNVDLAKGQNTITTNPIKQPGTYTFTFYNNTNEKIGSQTVIIDVIPRVNITPESSTVKYGASQTLTVIVSGGISPYTYSWTGPNSFTSSGNPVTISNITQSGLYKVTVTDYYNQQAAGLAFINVASSPLSAIIISSYNYISVIPAGGLPPYKYSWKGPHKLVSSEQIITNPPCGKYTVVVTDAAGQSVTLKSKVSKCICLKKHKHHKYCFLK